MVSDTLRLPLRAVVASSSATRSSRSAQQSPPRSAAFAAGTPAPSAIKPRAANSAVLLADFNSPPIITNVSVDQLPEFKSDPTEFTELLIPARAGGKRATAVVKPARPWTTDSARIEGR